MIKRYGGVPLITIPQEMTDDLYVKRNSTKECFDFIIDELKLVQKGCQTLIRLKTWAA